MRLRINGRERDIEGAPTVADLLRRLELPERGVAVERNREIVPKTRHGQIMLKDGDVLEIVALVGGG